MLASGGRTYSIACSVALAPESRQAPVARSADSWLRAPDAYPGAGATSALVPTNVSAASAIAGSPVGVRSPIEVRELGDQPPDIGPPSPRPRRQ